MTTLSAPTEPARSEIDLQGEGMPVEAFLQLDERAELINGKVKRKLAHLFERDELLHLLFFMLSDYVRARKLGEVYMQLTFVLPDQEREDWVKGSRIPDLAFYAGTRMADYKTRTPNYGKKPRALVPDFVIEIISPNDTLSDVDEKVDAYLSDGVRLIWLIDPQRRKITIYAPDEESPTVLKGDAVLSAGDIVPDFELSLSKLFAEI
jgi:Uma2 family endonuclease